MQVKPWKWDTLSETWIKQWWKCQVKPLAAVSKNSADLYQLRTRPAKCHGGDSLLAVPGVKGCSEMDESIS